jgi:phage/plasmid primase-like uncharacterized protein
MLDLNDIPQQSDGAKPRAHTRPQWAGDVERRAEPSLDDALVEFRQAAAQRGVSLPPEIIIDGDIHRCDTTGKNGDGDAAYLFHADGLPAGGFQNWQDAIGWQDWHSDPGRPLTPAESDELRRKEEADRDKRLAAREARRANTAARARDIWEKAANDPDHPYLARKGIAAHGVRQEDRTNYLVVPIKDASGAIINLQRIDAEGIKRFLPGGRKEGGLFGIGGSAEGPVLIAEGFSTSATIHQATGFTIVVAFDSGNLPAVAAIVRDQFPNGEILICADDDWKVDGNPGVSKAGEAAGNISAKLVIPDFGQATRTEGDTDFNDVAKLLGEAEVKRQIDEARIAPPQEIEIVPPARSIADVDALIQTLDRSGMGSESERQTMTMAMRGLASLNLGLVTEEGVLKQIVARTGATLVTLKKGLSQLKREMGVKITLTPEANVICRRYVFVKQINAFWDREGRTVCELKGVANMHRADMPMNDEGDKHIDPLDIMLDGALGMTCDRVDAIGFLPGEEEIFQEGGTVVLNMWTKPNIVAIEGDVSKFLNHVDYLIDGDAFITKYILDYLAHLVQRPAEKIKSTILIIGEEGIGKSAIGEMMFRLLGEDNATTIEDSDLRSSFNEWMEGIQLVLINELHSVDTRETLNRLKSYITDPWIRINRKKVSTYKYRNRVNFMLFSNHDDAARIEKGDRRYMIWKSKAIPRDEQYYTDLWDWFDRGGAENLLFHLQHRDISQFKANSAPPTTQSKGEVMLDSRNAVDAYLQDLFDAEASPFLNDLVVVTDIMEYLADRKKNRVVTHKQVTAFLRKVGASLLGQKRLRDNTRPSVWAIRNQAIWEEATEADIKDGWRDIEEAPLTEAERARIFGLV